MKTLIFCFSLILLFFVLSCKNEKNKKASAFKVFRNISCFEKDTIKVFGFKMPVSSDSCLLVANRFHEINGVFISNYYVLLDSLDLDLNNDNVLDRLLVLSPKNLECDKIICLQDVEPKRLLVEIINKKNSSKIRNIYPNLISSEGGVLSHYNGIFKTCDGFEIVHQAGAKYSWTFQMIFTVSDSTCIKLKSIKKTCTYNGINKIINSDYKNITCEKINISDTLANNCNCDKYWEELEN